MLRRKAFVAFAIAIAAFLTAATPGSASESLRALDSRADGSRVLNLIVHPEPVPAPEIRFLDAEGNALTLADFRGRYTAVHFWATWCFPCRG